MKLNQVKYYIKSKDQSKSLLTYLSSIIDISVKYNDNQHLTSIVNKVEEEEDIGPMLPPHLRKNDIKYEIERYFIIIINLIIKYKS